MIRDKKAAAPARNSERIKAESTLQCIAGAETKLVGAALLSIITPVTSLSERDDEHKNTCAELPDIRQSAWIYIAWRVLGILRTRPENKPLCQGRIPKTTPKFGDSLGDLLAKIYHSRKI